MLPATGELGSAGAFIDTTGERGRKRKKIPVQVVADTEEEELEAVVFGRQLFKPVAESSSSESDSCEESEDEEDVGRGGKGERGAGDEPAWRDEDDDELRWVGIISPPVNFISFSSLYPLSPPLSPSGSVDMMSRMHRKRLRQEESDRMVTGHTYSRRLRAKSDFPLII